MQASTKFVRSSPWFWIFLISNAGPIRAILLVVKIKKQLIVAIYIDDCLIAETDENYIENLTSYLKREFEFKVFKLNTIWDSK